jgi:hypothetical protein
MREVYCSKAPTITGIENSLSFICCDPIASFQVQGDTAEKRFPDGQSSLNKS